jgi:hypothetical protein
MTVLMDGLNEIKGVETSVSLLTDIENWPSLIGCNVGTPHRVPLAISLGEDLKIKLTLMMV